MNRFVVPVRSGYLYFFTPLLVRSQGRRQQRIASLIQSTPIAFLPGLLPLTVLMIVIDVAETVQKICHKFFYSLEEFEPFLWDGEPKACTSAECPAFHCWNSLSRPSVAMSCVRTYDTLEWFR